jgi:sigma-54 dependent transcriptional regulator, acetoin dehydrogenase operon transcriptional activator AcoR
MINRANIPQQLIPSWNRCIKFGVDPYRVNNEFLSQKELIERIECMDELIESSAFVLDSLSQQLKGTDFMIVLSDLDGYILKIWGDSPFVDEAKKVWLDIGANWSEPIKGTNAIGTSLIEQKPVSVRGEQHYCLEHHFLTCSATPIYSATGQCLGILDISGNVQKHSPHTLAMVVTAAQACQSHLLLKNTDKQLVLQMREADVIMQSVEPPLLSVDADGYITKINQSAAKMLCLSVEKCIGQPLSHWLGLDQMASLLSLKDPTCRSFVINKEERTWIIQPVLDQRNQLFRMLIRSSQELTSNQPKSSIQTKETKQWMQCEKVKQVYQFALRVAQTDAIMLLYGETGTGKGMLAKAIHQASKRKGAFLTVNCGAIPASLIEAELFGYEKGAFTGAKSEGHPGKFEAANGGTLFLDEIGDLSSQAQVSLLKVLEEKEITRIGSHQPIQVDVRIIAATHKDLAKEVTEGRFRADLYYRLYEVQCSLPPLRERTDFFELVDLFLAQISEELEVSFIISSQVKNRLQQYDWPGNIRELRQTIRQAAYRAYFGRQDQMIHLQDFTIFDQSRSREELSLQHDRFKIEEEKIKYALQITGGNMTAAARKLGIGRTTLYRKIDQYPNLKMLQKHYKKGPHI